jgi:hypothetical protein
MQSTAVVVILRESGGGRRLEVSLIYTRASRPRTLHRGPPTQLASVVQVRDSRIRCRELLEHK